MRQQENTAQLIDKEVAKKKKIIIKASTISIEYVLMYMYHCTCISGLQKTNKLK